MCVFGNGVQIQRCSKDDLACCAVQHVEAISEEPICKSGSLCQPPSYHSRTIVAWPLVQDNMHSLSIHIHCASVRKGICFIPNCFVTIICTGPAYLYWKGSRNMEIKLKGLFSKTQYLKNYKSVSLDQWSRGHRLECFPSAKHLFHLLSPSKRSLFYTCIQTQTIELGNFYLYK